MSKVRCIIFDLGKVIVPFELQRGYAELERCCGLPAAEIPKRIATTDLVERFETGKVASEDFVGQLCALLGFSVDYPQFCRMWSSIFLPGPLVPESLVEALGRRYRLMLLSNTNAIHFAMIRESYPILRHFQDFVLSYEIGVLKPDPRIYQEAVNRAGCRPEECFFIDDIHKYVEGAQQVGMQAVRFQGAEQLERDLRAHGVEWDGDPAKKV
jgi:putative hydrolase of the HAD superfamily